MEIVSTALEQCFFFPPSDFHQEKHVTFGTAYMQSFDPQVPVWQDYNVRKPHKRLYSCCSNLPMWYLGTMHIEGSSRCTDTIPSPSFCIRASRLQQVTKIGRCATSQNDTKAHHAPAEMAKFSACSTMRKDENGMYQFSFSVCNGDVFTAVYLSQCEELIKP